ncbi:hypothetical protein [Pinibacter aurantiacus]|uniref:Uncharacterized protein n=1 Tax=Pinibacter aurantiacus TaxID=2851599 RepID=A0A9E2SAM3_9BACT|nr:hypothetical protein [Pinibacter aurantiacus]MBV4359036.1 hypothetical protein [Pinibacter aurantiacus]
MQPGFNIQSAGATTFLPAATDIAATLGYKLNDKSVIGVGLSYKMGWGAPVKDIHISHEGFGLRSYLDYKIKGGWWASGGVEMNYMQSFKSLRELHDNVTVWQHSALLGVTKKIAVGKYTNNVQLLYDFLWRQQVPNGQPVKFRVGIGLK